VPTDDARLLVAYYSVCVLTFRYLSAVDGSTCAAAGRHERAGKRRHQFPREMNSVLEQPTTFQPASPEVGRSYVPAECLWRLRCWRSGHELLDSHGGGFEATVYSPYGSLAQAQC